MQQPMYYEDAATESPDQSMLLRVSPRPIDKDQQLLLQIEQAKIEKNLKTAQMDATLESVRRSADRKVAPLVKQDHEERINQQEYLANEINNVLTPRMAQEQERARVAQEQQSAIMGQLAGMQAPTQQRGQLGLPEILSAGIAALFGGAQGVNQALEGGYKRANEDAQMQFQNEGRQYDQQQQNMMLQLQQLGLDEKTAQHAFEVLRGRTWDLQDQGAKSVEAEKARALKLTLEQMKQEGKLDLKAVDAYRTVFGKVPPEARGQVLAQMMAAAGGQVPPELLQAVNELTTAEQLQKANTDFVTGPKTEGAKLDNDKKRIENEWLPKLLETKLWKNQKDAEFVATKIKYYPQFLQATMWRAAIAQQMANNSIGNTEFDNRMDVWKTQGGARIKTYQQEIAGHLKRIAAIDKELGAVNKDTGVGVDPITSTAKTVEKQRIMVRIQQLQQKIEDEVQQVPAVVPGADTPMPEGGALTDTNSPPTNPLSGSVDSGASNTRTRTRTRTNKATPPNKGGVVYQDEQFTVRKKPGGK